MTPRYRNGFTWTVLIGAFAAVLLPVPALRMAAALLFCLLLPGYGWARRMRPGDWGDRLALALVLSICATVAVSTTMAVSRHWSTAWGLVVLGVISVTGFLPQGLLTERLLPSRRRREARAVVTAGSDAHCREPKAG